MNEWMNEWMNESINQSARDQLSINQQINQINQSIVFTSASEQMQGIPVPLQVKLFYQGFLKHKKMIMEWK